MIICQHVEGFAKGALRTLRCLTGLRSSSPARKFELRRTSPRTPGLETSLHELVVPLLSTGASADNREEDEPALRILIRKSLGELTMSVL